MIKTVSAGIALAATASILGAGFANATPVNPTPAPIASALKPVASNHENMSALSALETELSVAGSIGAIGGGVIGAGIGCVIGLPAGGVGCIPGGLAGAAAGATIGALVTGVPVLIAGGIDTINTFNAAPNTTRWEDRNDFPVKDN